MATEVTIKWQMTDGEDGFRRFTVSEPDFDAIMAKIKELQPDFDGKIGWKDSDGDLVLICCNTDVEEALKTTENRTIKLITIGGSQPTKQVDNSMDTTPVPSQPEVPSSHVVHHGIYCDGCDNAGLQHIQGVRYKCQVCPDYDLCSTCLSAGKHNHHTFTTITAPAGTLGSQIPTPSEPVQLLPSRIRRLYIISEIQSRFATTRIFSEVVNRSAKCNELTFTAQLPVNAFITKFYMQIEDKVIEGEVKKKKEAAAIYNQAKHQGKSSALTKKTTERDMNVFTTSVNVSGYSKVYFCLVYQEILERQHGCYKHVINVHPDQPVDDVQIQVRLADRQPLKNLRVPKFVPMIAQMTNVDLMAMPSESKASIEHDSGNDYHMADIRYKPDKPAGQLVVLYDVERPMDGGHIQTVDGYFVHFIAPPELAVGSKHICFVVDRSGSMSGKKIQQTKHAMKVVLQSLRPTDQFTIITFDDKFDVSKTALATDANKESALKFVDTITPRGCTDLYGAIERGIKVLQNATGKELVKMVVFLTDGEPTSGITNGEQIVKKLSQVNKSSKFSIHGISFGEGSDHRLVQRIAQSNQGLAKKVYEDADADLQLKGFFGEISNPVLRDVVVDYVDKNVDVSSLVKSNDSSQLFGGSELVVFGKLNDATKTVKANLNGTSTRHIENLMTECTIVDRSCYRVHWRRPCIIRVPVWPVKFEEHVSDPSTTGGFIERMWVCQSVQRLMNDAALSFSADDEAAKLKRALELSLKYGLVTDQTSMVITPPGTTEPLVPCLRPWHFIETSHNDHGHNRRQYAFGPPTGGFGSLATDGFCSPAPRFGSMTSSPTVSWRSGQMDSLISQSSCTTSTEEPTNYPDYVAGCIALCAPEINMNKEIMDKYEQEFASAKAAILPDDDESEDDELGSDLFGLNQDQVDNNSIPMKCGGPPIPMAPAPAAISALYAKKKCKKSAPSGRGRGGAARGQDRDRDLDRSCSRSGGSSSNRSSLRSRAEDDYEKEEECDDDMGFGFDFEGGPAVLEEKERYRRKSDSKPKIDSGVLSQSGSILVLDGSAAVTIVLGLIKKSVIAADTIYSMVVLRDGDSFVLVGEQVNAVDVDPLIANKSAARPISDDFLSSGTKIVVITDAASDLGSFGGLLKYIRTTGNTAVFVCNQEFSTSKRAALDDITGGNNQAVVVL